MSLLSRLKGGLKKTSGALSSGITGLFQDNAARAELLSELEDLLIMADMGASTAAHIIAELEEKLPSGALDEKGVKQALSEEITARLQANQKTLALDSHQPFVIMAVGVNGNGKTTSLGKLAKQFKEDGKSVMLVAADTFRAAAVEQLEEWAKRTDAHFVKGDQNQDPASVVYQALEQAKSQGVDVVLVDTAGRLHNKQNLMAELQKIKQVAAKIVDEAPHMVLQMIDATTGQNALAQVSAFIETAGVNGLVITKLDGTAKAGIAVALSDQFKLPIYYIGVGEAVDDLMVFDAKSYTDSLLDIA